MTRTFDVPAEQVWEFASQPANISRWVPTTHRSSGGAAGEARLVGESHGHRYDATAALRMDEDARQLSWSAAGFPGYEGSLIIAGQDGRSELTVHLRLPDGHAAAAQADEVERGLAEALEGLAKAAQG